MDRLSEYWFFGLNNYLGNQKSGYINLIYQDILGTTDWKYRTGISLVYDDYNEVYQGRNFGRREVVPGAFYELSFQRLRWNIIGGIRYDQHNLYGGAFTPRIHARYDLTENTTLRASAGSGWRVANVLMRKPGWFGK